LKGDGEPDTFGVNKLANASPPAMPSGEYGEESADAT
jgi:hypothetical protein